jgi:hypothetical protein
MNGEAFEALTQVTCSGSIPIHWYRIKSLKEHDHFHPWDAALSDTSKGVRKMVQYFNV